MQVNVQYLLVLTALLLTVEQGFFKGKSNVLSK